MAKKHPQDEKGGITAPKEGDKPASKPTGANSATMAANSAINCAFDGMVIISQVKPNPRNPNTHSPEQVDKLAVLIQAHGWRNPITVSTRSGLVVSGHCRLLAAQKLGLKEVPVDYQDFDSDAQEWAVMVADNIVAELAEIDGLKMGELLCELDQLNYGLELTALTPEEIEDYVTGPGMPTDQDDIVPEPPKKPITKTGDLWLLGNHRLLCGDSTKEADVARLMNGQKADMVFTDPPYGVNYEGGSGNENKRDKIIGDQNSELYYPALKIAYDFTIDKVAVYLWFAGFEVIQAVIQADFKIRNLLIWNKLNVHYGCLNAQYKHRHEPFLYLHKRGKSPNWFGPNTECTVWDVEQASINEFHPTQKPVALAERAIRNSSKRKQIILDGFLGSGSTLIACEKLNRRLFGMEIEPIYVDVAVKRWEDFTHKKAKLLKGK